VARRPLLTRPAPIGPASFPRVPAGASPSVVAPGVGLPLVAPYDPPVIAVAPAPPPVVADGVGDGYESASRSLLCADIPAPTTGWAPIYATGRRWAACDVWITTDYFPTAPALGIGWLSFALVAVTRGIRTVVSTGRVRGTSLGAPAPGVRVASGRMQADRWEVYATRNGSPASSDQSVNVSIVASDEASTPIQQSTGLAAPSPYGQDGMIPVASGDGAISATSPQSFSSAQGNIPFTPTLIHAVNAAAAMRYLQFSATAAGATIASLAIPAGGSLVESDPVFLQRFTRGGTSELHLRSSSAPVALAAVVDVSFRWWVR